MRRSTSVRPLLVVAILAVGGILLLEQPYLTAAVGVSTSPLLTPQQSAPSPLRLPTLTPTPRSTPTLPPTIIPLSRSRSPSSFVPAGVTPIPAFSMLNCTQQEGTIACSDDLLEMDFRYPAFMGQLFYTRLRRGGYTGFSYEYVFENTNSFAGGRSSDFGEGRERFLTDQMGLAGRKPGELCAEWPGSLCYEISPGVLLIILFPQPEQLCSQSPTFTAIPTGFLILDLPQHPLINGFAFVFRLLPLEAEAAFREQWYSYDWRDTKTQCQPLEPEFRRYIEVLRTDLQKGKAAAEIQQRYDAMFQLAKSIQSPYIATTPQSP